MAISPRLLNDAFMSEVKLFEERIDAQLVQKPLLMGWVNISIDLPHGLTDDHFKVLRPRYLNAGWSDVTKHSDQREGDWIVFKL
jgi:hypothetical protein